MLAPDAGAARAAGGGLTMKRLGAPRAARAAEKPADVAVDRARHSRPALGDRRGGAGARLPRPRSLVVGGVFDGGGGRSGSGESGSATSLATVTRRSLSTQTQFNGTLGYAGSYTVLGQAHGTVTWLPKVGQVVRQGQVLYRVDEAPVVLLYGATPGLPRTGRGDRRGVTGADVAQLNHDLVALGYVDSAEVDSAWDEFSWATKAGVEKLQHHLGVDQTGKLALGMWCSCPPPRA